MNSKMSKKVAGFFAKKGNKKLAAHERRESAGMEEDTPAIAKKEMSVLKGAPAPMRAYESKEHKEMGMGMGMGMKKGGMACGGMKKYATGGAIKKPYVPSVGDLNEKSGGDQEMENRKYMEEQRRKAKPAPPVAPKPKLYAKGGGIESKGKSDGRMIKMASGGSVSARADGIASKGKTNCKQR